MFKKLKEKTFLIGALLFIFIFGFYLFCSPRVSTNFADSNELVAASHILGIPHPPGYPLFLIIGKIFSFIPIGEIVFRYSIFCSFFSGLTCVLVYFIILKILGYESKDELRITNHESRIEKGKKSESFIIHNSKFIIPALAGALCLAFSYNFWLYSIVPETFSLLCFFTALLIYLCICWYKDEKDGKETENYAFFIAFCSALGFLSQQLIAILAPALFYIIFVIDRKIFFPSKRWIKVFAGFFLGFLPLIYFPLVAQTEPVIDYGNPTSLKGMWDYVTRRIYADVSESGSAYFRPDFNIRQSLKGATYYLEYIVNQFGLAIVLIGAIGILIILAYLGFRFYKSRLNNNYEIKISYPIVFVLLTFLFSGPLLSMYLVHDYANASYNVKGAHERMFIYSLVSFSILIGFSINKILKVINKINLSVPIISMILICLPLGLLAANFKHNNKSNFYLGEDYAFNLFLNMEPNAIFFTRGDMPSFAAYYVKYVKGQRQDVTIIPFSMQSWAIERLQKREPDLWDTESNQFLEIIRDIIRDNIDKRPIYFTGIPDTHIVEFGLAANPFILSPRGLITQAGHDFDPKEDTDFWEMRWHGSSDIEDYKDWYSKEIFEQYVIGGYNSMLHYQKRGYYDLAFKEFERVKKIDPQHRDVEKAMEQYRLEGKKQRDVIPFQWLSPEEYLKIGYKYLERGRQGCAMAEFWMAKELEPENIEYRLELAKSYELLTWYREAKKEYQEVLELDPENQEAKERLIVVGEKLKK